MGGILCDNDIKTIKYQVSLSLALYLSFHLELWAISYKLLLRTRSDLSWCGF